MRLVALYRVSTDKQGESGLGLKGQQAAVEAYRVMTGGRVIAEYTEIESGKHDRIEKRPDFVKAVTHAKRANAVLVIAKMDRLVRSLVVLSYLKQSGIRFLACDNPHANELTVDVLVAVAAQEARDISQRTKSALGAYKAHRMLPKRIRLAYPDGVPQHVQEAYEGRRGKLGASLPECRNNLSEKARVNGRRAGVEAVKANADRFAADLYPIVRELRESGRTLQEIADHLNSLEFRTARGCDWNHVAVKRVLERVGS